VRIGSRYRFFYEALFVDIVSPLDFSEVENSSGKASKASFRERERRPGTPELPMSSCVLFQHFEYRSWLSKTCLIERQEQNENFPVPFHPDTCIDDVSVHHLEQAENHGSRILAKPLSTARDNVLWRVFAFSMQVLGRRHDFYRALLRQKIYAASVHRARHKHCKSLHTLGKSIRKDASYDPFWVLETFTLNVPNLNSYRSVCKNTSASREQHASPFWLQGYYGVVAVRHGGAQPLLGARKRVSAVSKSLKPGQQPFGGTGAFRM